LRWHFGGNDSTLTFAINFPSRNNTKMKTLIIALSITCITLIPAAAVERPSDAQLHAYKAYHHAIYLKDTAAEAGGTNNKGCSGVEERDLRLHP
jgi:hypothetical protein